MCSFDELSVFVFTCLIGSLDHSENKYQHIYSSSTYVFLIVYCRFFIMESRLLQIIHSMLCTSWCAHRANLGSVLRDLGRSEDALAAYERGLLMSPDDPLLKQQHLAMLQLLGKKTKNELQPSLASSVEASFMRGATAKNTHEPPASLHAAPSTDGAASGASSSTSASTGSQVKSSERQLRNHHARKIPPPLTLPVKPSQAPPAGVSSLVHCATTKVA